MESETEEDNRSELDLVSRAQDGRQCIVHVYTDNCLEIIKFSEKSWKKVRLAANVYGDKLLIDSENIPEEKYGYHRECYAKYTHKQQLERAKKRKLVETESKKIVTDKRPCRRMTGGNVLAKKECCICRTKKTSKSNSGYEKLVKCVTQSAASSLQQAALTKQDDYPELYTEICGIQADVIVAKEYHYHESCRCILLRTYDSSNSSVTDMAFKRLVNVVEHKIINSGGAMKMKLLVEIFTQFKQAEKEPLEGLITKNVKSRLITYFGKKLCFWAPPGKGEIVFSDEIPTQKAFEWNLSSGESSDIESAAKAIRKDILDHPKTFSNWPPTINELYQSDASIPSKLEQLLINILSSKGKATKRISRLAKSIGQDLVYNTTRGRNRQLKHVQLGLNLKRKTGSKDVITWMNRFGHAISSDEVNLVETSIARNLASILSRKFVPSIIQPSIFVTFVYDNCDHNLESKFNLTMHCTNGIMIQKSHNSDIGTCAPGPILHQRDSRKRRSFNPVQQELAPFIKQPRSEPATFDAIEIGINEIDALHSKNMDRVWYLTRYSSNCDDAVIIPGWKGFFKSVLDTSTDVHNVAYLPTISESPTKLATVQEVLFQCKAKAEALNLAETDLVLDHAIYAKALEILLKEENSSLKEFINLRMGDFHGICIFLGVLGKRFGDAGLKDLVVEAGLIGSESVAQALKGKHYNNALRIHFAAYEAITRKKMEKFEEWLHSKNKYDVMERALKSEEYSQLCRNQTQESFNACMRSWSDLFELLDEFDEFCQDCERSPLTAFWNSYLEMMQVLMNYMKSIKLGDWHLYLNSIGNMLPWFHAYDNHNYARHFTYYWATQQALPNTHPNIYREFLNGGFSIKRSKGIFNKVPPDQVIEQTINKDQKGPGGIIGYSTSYGTVQRWILTSHVVAKIKRNMEDSLSMNVVKTARELLPSEIKFSEASVKKCYDVLENWPAIFDNSQLMSLSSGRIADEEVESDLLRAKVVGEQCLRSFITDRLIEKSVPFYDPIKKKKLKTFGSMKAKATIKVRQSQISLSADRKMFARMLIIQRKRSIDLRQVLRYSLGPIAWALANGDGTIHKTVKSKLLNILELKMEIVQQPIAMEDGAVIYDGMCLIQQLPPGLNTFGDISDLILKRIMAGSTKQVYFITDQYLHDSIKSCERDRRGASGDVRITATRRDQPSPKQMKKFLRNGCNKTDLVWFLMKDWSQEEHHKEVIMDKELFITVEDQAFLIRNQDDDLKCIPVHELCSSQEEADTKMFLAAKHASRYGKTSATIVTVDSDVAILACYYASLVDLQLWVRIGTGNNVRYLDPGSVAVDRTMRLALPALHAISGCDSVSSMNGIGKAKWMKLMDNDDYKSALALLGEGIEVSESVSEVLEKMVCKLYGTNATSVTDARYEKFCKKSIPDPFMLPPTKGELDLHVKRANYQALIWKKALEREPNIPSPVGHGWDMQDGNLKVIWMTDKPAPESVLELIVCNCKRKCSSACQCLQHGLNCTDACPCGENCSNSSSDDVVHDDIDSNDESDYEEDDADERSFESDSDDESTEDE